MSLTEQLVTEQIARDVYDDRLRFLQSEVRPSNAMPARAFTLLTLLWEEHR